MEPLSILAIATSVVQFVDFSSKIISGSRELYKSSTGLTKDNADLEKITKTLREMSSTITRPMDSGPSSEHMDQLRVLCQNIDQIAQELITALESVKQNKGTRWDSCLQAIRSVWNDNRITTIRNKLNDLRQQLTLILVVILRDEVYSDQKSVKHGINDIHEEFMRYINENRQWQADMRRAIQNRYASQPIDDNTLFTPNTIEKLGLRSSSDTFARYLLASLSFRSINDRHGHIHDRHRETCEWVFQDTDPDGILWENFVRWLKDDSSLYWITGKAGSGKSTLMKFLHDDARTRTIFSSARNLPVVEAGFFFWNSGTEMQTSQLGLVRTLLSQVLRQCPDSAPIAFPEEWEIYSLLRVFEDNEWSWIELRQAFLRLAKHVCSSSALLLLIDGLDEYTGNHSDVVAFIMGLESLSLPNFKICASSRPWVVFEDAFCRRPSLRMQDLTLPDMITYTSTKFGESQGFTELEHEHPEFSKQLVREIADKAMGVFLWVVLVVQSLLLGLANGDEIEDLRNRLDDLPSDLEELFQKIFNDIEPKYRLQASKLFQLFRAFTEQPTILTLAFAEYPDIEDALVHPINKMTPQELKSKLERTRRRLNSRCRGLLEVTSSGLNSSSPVFYLHRTVKDFMETETRWNMIVSFGPPSFEPYSLLSKSFLMQLKTVRTRGNTSGCVQWCLRYALNTPETDFNTKFRIVEALEACLSEIAAEKRPKIHGSIYRLLIVNLGGVPADIISKVMPHMESFIHYAILAGEWWYVKEKVERGLNIHQPPDLMPLQFVAAIAMLNDHPTPTDEANAFFQFLFRNGCDPNETFHAETLFDFSSQWLGSPNLKMPKYARIIELHRILGEHGETKRNDGTESWLSNLKRGLVRSKPDGQKKIDTRPSGHSEPSTGEKKSSMFRSLLFRSSLRRSSRA